MNEKKEMTCCFTGHRSIPFYEIPLIKRKLRKAIIEAIKDGYKYFGTGGAVGFDTISALTVLNLKKDYPEIKLILVLPCENQTRNWKNADIKQYEWVKSKADKVVYVSKEYTRDCMFKRNRHLVDNSSRCICYCNKENGGTSYKNWKRRSYIILCKRR